MNAKEYLSQAIWLDRIIQNKMEQKEKLEAMAQKTTVDLSQEKVSGGKTTTSAMEKATVKMIALQNEIDADINRLFDLKREIQGVINQLSDISYQLVLEMRYVNGKSWEEVIRDIGFDRSTIFRIHGKALKEITSIINSATK